MDEKSELDFEDDFERNMEIARSSFADMLHDSERNQRYLDAIKEAIKIQHDKGEKANCLEIGTGTGLLAMLAAKHGADNVTTIEAFGPISNVAKKLIEINGFKDQINVIQKHSSKVKLGVDLKERANILITELFDTELIGEGAIDSYNYAHQHLMVQNCLAIPTKASIFIQVIESPAVLAWNKMKLIVDLDGNVLLNPPRNVLGCFGSSSIHDVQLSQFSGTFKTLVEPTEICEIDFSRPDISENFKKTFTFKSNNSGSPQAVFFWWNLQMNPSASNLLSCAPWWAHPDIKNITKDALQSSPQNLIPWRDHWMQGIFYLNGNNFLNSGQEFSLTAYHDKFSWWFSLDEDLNCRPICECLFHMNSRTRIAEINDSLRTKKFMKLFERLDFQNDQEILILGDNCLIALCLAKLGAKLINILEENSLSRKVTNQFIESNQLENSVKIHENLDSISKVSLVFAEPHFLEADLPWDNISEFLKRLKVLREKFGNEFKIIPTQAKIYAVPVHFLDLYKIRSPLGEVESFDHRIFDQFIEEASNLVDKNVEPFSLWEYPATILGSKKCIFEVDFSEEIGNLECSGNLDIESTCKQRCNGIAMWMNWHLDGNIILNGGLVNEDLELNQQILWTLGSRQGVHLISSKNQPIQRITTIVNFNSELSEIFMNFKYE